MIWLYSKNRPHNAGGSNCINSGCANLGYILGCTFFAVLQYQYIYAVSLYPILRRSVPTSALGPFRMVNQSVLVRNRRSVLRQVSIAVEEPIEGPIYHFKINRFALGVGNTAGSVAGC